MPNIIRVIHYTKNKITLKKTYDITLLNIFPLVLEHIIRDYINDVIEVSVKSTIDGLKCTITDQYINCNKLSFTIIHQINDGVFVFLSVSSNITRCSVMTSRSYPYTALLNYYMKQYYQHDLYFDCTTFYSFHYLDGIQEIIQKNNKITYSDNFNDGMRPAFVVNINNHKLFKNMIVIIKCLYNKFNIWNRK